MKVTILINESNLKTPVYVMCWIFNKSNKFSGFVSVYNRNWNDDFYYKDWKMVWKDADWEDIIDTIKVNWNSLSKVIYDYLEKDFWIVFKDGYLVKKWKYKVVFKDFEDWNSTQYYTNLEWKENPINVGRWIFGEKKK